MKTVCRQVLLLPFVLIVWTLAARAGQPQKLMPPVLSQAADPADVLQDYPLGSITEQEAFAHYGSAIRKVTLPNGRQGWLYLAGEEAGIPSLYVLEFSESGVVIDVLHKGYRHKMGHSALQYQYLQQLETGL